MFEVSLFCLKISKLIVVPIQTFALMYCNSATNLNILIILSALEALEYVLFIKNNTLILHKGNNIFREIS